MRSPSTDVVQVVYCSMEMEEKYFTPKEAVKTLPLVKRIVSDILSLAGEIRQYISEHPEAEESEEYITSRLSKIQACMDELLELGCYYKDWNFSVGLVDFPSVIDGEDVFLCWRSDEENIRYFHRREDGFAGRKPIPEIYFN